MRLTELILKLEKIKAKGFIKSIRKGSTGIGYIFEKEIGLNESNISIPDIGGRIECKTTRRQSNSLITLLTFNRGVWKMRQHDVLEQFGYYDENQRLSLYCTVRNKIPNSQGFYFEVDTNRNLIILKNTKLEKEIAEWSIYVIAGKLLTKLDRLLLVIADSEYIDNQESFYFNEAYLLENPSPEKIVEAFQKDVIFIDLRLHLKSSGGVRNHGTGFRTAEKNLIHLYNNVRKLI